MLYPSIDKLLKQVGSKYLLVNIVARRAKNIDESKHLQMKECEYKSSKSLGCALEEVSNNLVHIKEQ